MQSLVRLREEGARLSNMGVCFHFGYVLCFISGMFEREFHVLYIGLFSSNGNIHNAKKSTVEISANLWLAKIICIQPFVLMK